jgi:hypothetical protein
MKRERAKKLLQVLGNPLLLEFLKGVAKGLGLLLISQLLR